MSENRPLPCPWCGSKGLEIILRQGDHIILCLDCGRSAIGEHGGKRDAIAAWNFLATLREENATLRNRRAAMCAHCGHTEHYGDSPTPESVETTVLAMMKHDRECPKNPLVHELAALRAERDAAVWLLEQIIFLLPANRDWLDPSLERAARDIIARKAPGVDRDVA